MLNYATNPVLSPDVRALFVNNPQVFDPDGDGNARISGGISRRVDELGLRNFAFERSTLGTTFGVARRFRCWASYTWQWDVFGQYQRSRTDEIVRSTMSPARLSARPELDDQLRRPGRLRHRSSRLRAGESLRHRLHFARGGGIHLAGSLVLRRVRALGRRCIACGRIPQAARPDPISAAIGVEYRYDEYEFMPGATDLAREYGSASRGITAGGYDVSEVFGEVRVPLLSDMPFAHVLALEGAIRLFGLFEFRLGARRGARTRMGSGRVAAVPRCIQRRHSRAGYQRAVCADQRRVLAGQRSVRGSSQPLARRSRDFCVQQGVPAAEINNFVQAALGFAQVSGGNPNLKEETSDTMTIGAVLRLPFLERSMSQWITTRSKSRMRSSTINAQTTLDVCYQLLDADSEPCRAITRLAGNGQVFQVRASNSNIGSLSVKGVDLSADYTFALPDAVAFSGGAELSLMLNTGWMFERVSQTRRCSRRSTAPDSSARARRRAPGGSPDFKASSLSLVQQRTADAAHADPLHRRARAAARTSRPRRRSSPTQ